MGIRDFFHDIPYSLNGKHYGELAERPTNQAVKYVIGLVILAFLLMLIFGIPTLIGFGEYLEEEMTKIDKIQIDGKIIMNDPILIPQDDPIVAIDARENPTAEPKKILVTQKKFYWQTVSGEVKEVDMAEWFRNPESRKAIASFIFLIALLILPGFLFWLLALLLLKYLFIVTLFAGIIFVVLDLTKYKIEFRKAFNICAYASTLLIFVEVIFIPIGTDYLLPIFNIFWVQFYLVTLILYLSLVIIALVFAEQQGEGFYSKGHKKHKEKEKKKEEFQKEEEYIPPPVQEETIPVDEYGNRVNEEPDQRLNEDDFSWDSPVEKF